MAQDWEDEETQELEEDGSALGMESLLQEMTFIRDSIPSRMSTLFDILVDCKGRRTLSGKSCSLSIAGSRLTMKKMAAVLVSLVLSLEHGIGTGR